MAELIKQHCFSAPWQPINAVHDHLQHEDAMKRLILLLLIAYVFVWSASLRLANRQAPTTPADDVNAGDHSSTHTTNEAADQPLTGANRPIVSAPTTQVNRLAGLDCQRHGGPDDASHMVYWRDIPQDASKYFAQPPRSHSYVTFEPDEGAFNNIRMALETVVVLTLALNRTLVLPPSQSMLLLEEHISFFDFYPLDDIVAEQGGLSIIEMKNFLQRETFVDRKTGAPSIPPNNRTEWNGASRDELIVFYKWLRSVSTTPDWPSNECMVGFCANTEEVDHMTEEVAAIPLQGRGRKLRGKAAPVNGTLDERLADVLAHRTSMCVVDENEWKDVNIIHFKGDIASGSRLLIHFYAYVFFCDTGADLFMKRFIRDHLRYRDEIQCAAARIVKLLGGEFDAMHIRRGDFKVEKTLLNAETILANVEDVLDINTTLYIATDELDRAFFEPFLKRFRKVCFLSDFEDSLKGLNVNFHGHVEQLVAAKSRHFVGCYFSTFSGYIQRLRGYYSTLDYAPGYESGALPTSFHYAPIKHKTTMQQYQSIRKPIHSREWPIAWRDIDWGTDDY